MINPEFPYFLIGRRKRKPRSRHRMRKERGVKIKPYAVFFCEINPFFKVLRFEFISICKFTLFKNSIARVNVYFFRTGNKRHHLFEVRHKFFRIPCSAGVIAGSLNSAGQRSVVIETDNVVTLPAVQRNGNFCKGFKSLVGIYAVFCKSSFCMLIIIHIFTAFLFYPF